MTMMITTPMTMALPHPVRTEHERFPMSAVPVSLPTPVTAPPPRAGTVARHLRTRPSAAPPGAMVTYTFQHRRCGKVACWCHQVASATAHGPYCYAYWRDVEGRLRSTYCGKPLPEEADALGLTPLPPSLAASLRTRRGYHHGD